MKNDYKYLLSSGPDMSHLFDVQHFPLLRDAKTVAEQDLIGRSWKIERMEETRCHLPAYIEIDNSKQFAERKAEERRKAYRLKHGYKLA